MLGHFVDQVLGADRFQSLAEGFARRKAGLPPCLLAIQNEDGSPGTVGPALGGVIAGVLFVLPGVASIMALSIVYALFGKVGIVSALFFGLKAAVFPLFSWLPDSEARREIARQGWDLAFDGMELTL